VSVLKCVLLGAVYTNAPALDSHDVLPVRMQLRQSPQFQSTAGTVKRIKKF